MPCDCQVRNNGTIICGRRTRGLRLLFGGCLTKVSLSGTTADTKVGTARSSVGQLLRGERCRNSSFCPTVASGRALSQVRRRQVRQTGGVKQLRPNEGPGTRGPTTASFAVSAPRRAPKDPGRQTRCLCDLVRDRRWRVKGVAVVPTEEAVKGGIGRTWGPGLHITTCYHIDASASRRRADCRARISRCARCVGGRPS